jgi:hypothetical protein
VKVETVLLSTAPGPATWTRPWRSPQPLPFSGSASTTSCCIGPQYARWPAAPQRTRSAGLVLEQHSAPDQDGEPYR